MKNWRINLILVFIILFGAVIITRLVFIQILDKERWQTLAQGQQRFLAQVQGKRGEIFLRDRKENLFPLAINRIWPLIFISPAEIKEKEETAQALSLILNLEKDLILEKIKKENSYYELIKNKLTKEEVNNLKQLKKNLPGIYLGEETLRYYPQNFFASQVIGFLGGQEKGQYGIEGYYDKNLQGRQGLQKGERDVFGRLLGFLTKKGGGRGHDLILSIDYNIQFKVEQLLEEAKEEFDIKGGQIIVMDPLSGKILALADFPNFSPNEFFKEQNFEIFKNAATQKIFEPGSVFKPFIIAAALDQKRITSQTKYLDKGFVKIGNRIIRNYNRRIFGERTMTEALAKSINTGTVFILEQLGSELFLEYIEKFGFLAPTQIDLQGEVFSKNRNLKIGAPEINFATASYGQGIAITPIQLVRAFAVIANGGKLINPYLVTEKIIEQDKGIEIHSKISKEQVISQKTAFQMKEMLVASVEHKFSRRAQIPGYYIAGKTGTAEVPWGALGYDRVGYSDETIHTFVGFAPAFEPRFLILVKLDNPQRVREASVSAAPIFQKLAKYIIDYYQIPPDYIL